MAQGNTKKVHELLSELIAEGAEVRTTDKSGSSLTADALLSGDASADSFNAWVSWTKSF